MTRTSPSSDVEPTGVFAPPLRLRTLGLLISVTRSGDRATTQAG
jgi:hypothetical protein